MTNSVSPGRQYMNSNNNKIDHEDGLCCLDTSMRYSLLISGLISGKPTPLTGSVSRKCSTIYQVTICTVLVINVIISATIAWNSEEDKSLYYLFLKIGTLALYTEITFCCFVSFANCYRKSGLLAYYQQLEVVEKELRSLGVTIRKTRIRKMCKVTSALAWILTFSNIAIRVYDYAKHQDQDPIYGHYLYNRIDSRAIVIGLQAFGCIAVAIVLTLWVMTAVQFFATSFHILTLLEDYNKKLEEDVEASPSAVLNNIATYRLAHLELCTLISKANSCLSLIAGAKVGTGVVVLLLIFYLLSVAVSDPVASNLMLIFIYWIVSESTALSVIITIAHKVQEESTEGYNHLLRIIHVDSPITTDQLYQMQLFMNRVNLPETFKTCGLLDINKDLGLTILGFMVSYYLVMVQFNHAAVTPDSDCHCNTTNSTVT